MKKNAPGNKKRIARWLHKWPAVVVAAAILLFAISGIILNHRNLFSELAIDRSLLPPGYQYQNWNLGALRGAHQLTDSTLMVYGNVGIWKINQSTGRFSSANNGLPSGIDGRKTEVVLENSNKVLLAGTFSGLYRYDTTPASWIPVKIPGRSQRVVDLMQLGDSTYVMTRSELYVTTDLQNFSEVVLKTPEGYQHKESLFTTLWMLHSGELFGIVGQLFADLLGLVFIVLALTGIALFLFPRIIKRKVRRAGGSSSLVQQYKAHRKWHNKTGWYSLIFLIVMTMSGMFLRPPLLIPIAPVEVGIIPFTTLDSPNPWRDKLRRMVYNQQSGKILLYTSDGFYNVSPTLDGNVKQEPVQPPVSVMGCNVLLSINPGVFLVGSFSGLYLWIPASGIVVDAFTNQPVASRNGAPISDKMIQGLVKWNNHTLILDYRAGIIDNVNDKPFPSMPGVVEEASPMSLWNAALEVHTGRIFEHLLGPFYILYIPLMGLTTLAVLVSGFVLLLRRRRKEKS